jgi:mannose-6-phosphate isomerase-like protein (cupin superfamily)
MKRRNFIASGIIGSLTAANLLSETFAQMPTDKPRSITNKIKKRPLKPFYIKPENNTAVRTTKIRFNQVNNQFCTAEFNFPPKTMGPAPHVHKDLDEIMRVLKGTVTILVGEEVFEIKEGGWHLRPHGIVHTFWNAGDEPAIFIDFFPNQNFDVFLDELKNLNAQFAKEGLSPDSIEARKRSVELHAEWGMVIYHDQRKPLMEKYGLK